MKSTYKFKIKYSNGERIESIAFDRDVTQFKALEELLGAEKRLFKKTFNRIVSIEFI
ncbi:MAG TPA: hypothetical protein VF868_16115 [Bacteroidia bacterium]|jgi:hypothetical protein